MDPTILGALIGLAGGVTGALLAGVMQRAIAKDQIRAEFMRMRAHLAGEAGARLRARKEDILLESIAEAVAAADPELHKTVDYDRIVTLIHKCQLVVDPQAGETEGALNGALSNLGFAVRDAFAHEGDISSILGAQNALIEATRAYLRRQ